MTPRTFDPVYVPANIVTPSGTTIAAPQTTVLDVGAGVLEEVELQIPAGHVGVTGLRLLLAGQQVLPWDDATSWIVGDNFHRIFTMGVQIDRGFTAQTYNVGNYPHTHYLRFRLRALDSETPAVGLRLLSNDQLNAAG